MRLVFVVLLNVFISSAVHADETCFDSSRVINWSEDGSYRHITVDVHNRGTYRLRLSGYCDALSTAQTIAFRSGFGRRICGQAGDMLLVGRQRCPIREVVALELIESDQPE